MEWFVVTFALYKQVFSRAIALTAKNWPVMGSVFVYGLVMFVGGAVAGQFGFAGGLIVTLISACCISSFLYLVEMMVRTSKVSWEDFGRSFGIYLGDVVGVLFIFFIVRWLAYPALSSVPQGVLIILGIELLIVVLFNAVPELIYLGHHSSLALLSESYNFIAANWLEWFPATIFAGALVYAIAALPAPNAVIYLKYALMGLAIYFTMVMRGLLFMELAGSSRRSRTFRYRAGGV